MLRTTRAALWVALLAACTDGGVDTEDTGSDTMDSALPGDTDPGDTDPLDTDDTDLGDTEDTDLGDTEDTNDTGPGDTEDTDDTAPPDPPAFEGGSITFTATVEDDVSCGATWALTGVEYRGDYYCPTCEYMFDVASTRTSLDGDPCAASPYWYQALTLPDPEYYPDDLVGFGYIASPTADDLYGYFTGLHRVLFAFYEYDDALYGHEVLLSAPSAEAEVEGGTYARTGDVVAWTLSPEPVQDVFEAEWRSCDAPYVPYDDASPAEPPDATLAGTIADCADANKADGYTVTVPASSSATVHVEVTEADGFDPIVWANGADGCTSHASDDAFACDEGAFQCSGVFDGQPQTYDCCSAIALDNPETEPATYTLWVAIATGQACEGTQAAYTLAWQGLAEAPTLAHDDYAPQVAFEVSGTATIPLP